MADRTLRRSRNSVDRSTHSDDGSIGSDALASRSVPIEFSSESGTESNVERTTHSDTESVDTDERIGVVEIDPADLANFVAQGGTTGTDTGSDTGRKRRKDAGVKRGHRGSRKAQSQNLEAVAGLLHSFLPTLFNSQIWVITEEENKRISEAYSNFCMYHEVPLLTPKRMSELVLVSTAAMVYGTRVVATVNEKREKKAKQHSHVPTSFGKPNGQYKEQHRVTPIFDDDGPKDFIKH
jgi:hypothetical protein